MEDIVIVCADIGSAAKGSFGWWSSVGEGGTRPSTLASHVSGTLNAGRSVALGFECPLFVPLADDELQLTSARPGEGTRAWSGGAGCGALATGLVQTAWLLREIKRQIVKPAASFLSWKDFVEANAGLFLWEAFVTGKAKGDTHTADAMAGVAAFLNGMPHPEVHNAVTCRGEVYSLVGAALLRTGWSDDVQLLHQPSLVVRAPSAPHITS